MAKLLTFGQFILLLLAPAIVYAADNQTCFGSNLDADVLILGGGIAGVAAARTLHNRDVTDFLIIKAQSQLGGRVRTVELRPGSGIPINSGANWFHGYDPDQPDLHPLVQIINTPGCGGIEGVITTFTGVGVRTSQGVDITNSPRLRYSDYEAAATGIENLGRERQNAGMADISVREALSQSGWVVRTAEDEWVDWLEFTYCYAEPPDNSSLFNTVTQGDFSAFGDPERAGDFLITDSEGYAKVVRCLADEYLMENDPRVHLNTRVTRIEWSNDCVCATATVTGSNSTRTFCGRYAIVTFSIGVLQQLQAAGLEFDPPLPAEKVNAINSMHMAHYLNIVVEFNTRFWEQDIVYIGYVNESDGRYFPIVQELTHIQGATVVYMTVTDRLADRIIRQTEEQNRQEIIAVFNNAYNMALQPSDIRTLFLPDWDINPLFFGSYSNTPVGVTSETFATLRSPLGGRLFFSGEATSERYSSTVHGGYFSGIDTANDVLTEIQGSGVIVAVNWCLLIATVVVTWTLVV